MSTGLFGLADAAEDVLPLLVLAEVPAPVGGA